MANICYIPKKFSEEHTEVIRIANSICTEYAEQELVLTLRQIYYQFVARGFLPNSQKEYKRLGGILGDARMAGELDWDYMVDRTRNVVKQPYWDDPADMMAQAAKQFAKDMWKGQRVRCEVWLEKDAAIGVVESVCNRNQVPYFSCRGYTSQSEMWEGAQRIRYHIENGDRVVILHVGDHDPSGLDMTRDITDRLRLFVTKDWAMGWGSDLPRPLTVAAIKHHMRAAMWNTGGDITVRQDPWEIKRIALNRDQIEQYNPPPNPAKVTDSRFTSYMEETGLDESWELDALDPVVLQELIQDEIDLVRNTDLWEETERQQEREQDQMKSLSSRWKEVSTYLATHEVPIEEEES